MVLEHLGGAAHAAAALKALAQVPVRFEAAVVGTREVADFALVIFHRHKFYRDRRFLVTETVVGEFGVAVGTQRRAKVVVGLRGDGAASGHCLEVRGEMTLQDIFALELFGALFTNNVLVVVETAEAKFFGPFFAAGRRLVFGSHGQRLVVHLDGPQGDGPGGRGRPLGFAAPVLLK